METNDGKYYVCKDVKRHTKAFIIDEEIIVADDFNTSEEAVAWCQKQRQEDQYKFNIYQHPNKTAQP